MIWLSRLMLVPAWALVFGGARMAMDEWRGGGSSFWAACGFGLGVAFVCLGLRLVAAWVADEVDAQQLIRGAGGETGWRRD
jgi:hypothetical protein